MCFLEPIQFSEHYPLSYIMSLAVLSGIRVGKATGGTSIQYVHFSVRSSRQSSHPPTVSRDPHFWAALIQPCPRWAVWPAARREVWLSLFVLQTWAPLPCFQPLPHSCPPQTRPSNAEPTAASLLASVSTSPGRQVPCCTPSHS